jgi:hypothetical protein
VGISAYLEVSKVVPVLNQPPRHEDVLRSGGISSGTLNLGTRWEWSTSRTGRFAPMVVRSRVTHWIGGWIGPRGGLDEVAEDKIQSLPLAGI